MAGKLSCVRQVLQEYFRKFSPVFLSSSSGLWKCGKAERSWRGFSKLFRVCDYAELSGRPSVGLEIHDFLLGIIRA